MTKTEIIAKSNQYMMAQARHQLYEEPLIFTKGDMDMLYDIEGKEYIDCFSGIMVVSFGHCNREINEVIHKQLDTLQHISTFYLSEQMVELAEKLAHITPEGLQRSFFVNSGSEAVEGAMLLARAYTGNQLIVPVNHAYHGRTLLTAVSTNVSPTGDIDPRAKDLDIEFAPNGYCYRCPYQKTYPSCGIQCAHEVRKQLQQENHQNIAALLVEPIQGVGGVINPPWEYLREMQTIAHEFGGLLIVDEVQCGFARTGHDFYSNAIAGFRPDILCMAKAMGNGLAVGAYIARDEIGEALKVPTFATFGGSPIASAAALATIDYMQRHDMPGQAKKSGARFTEGLQRMEEEFPLIGNIRGSGLFIGVELVRDRITKEPAKEETLAMLEECKKRGLVIGKSGQKTNVLRIGPPLVITDEHIDKALDILHEAFLVVSKDFGLER